MKYTIKTRNEGPFFQLSLYRNEQKISIGAIELKAKWNYWIYHKFYYQFMPGICETNRHLKRIIHFQIIFSITLLTPFLHLYPWWYMCSTVEDILYSGGMPLVQRRYLQYDGGYCQYGGGYLVQWRDIISLVNGYYEYCRGILSAHQRISMLSSPATIGGIKPSVQWRVFSSVEHAPSYWRHPSTILQMICFRYTKCFQPYWKYSIVLHTVHCTAQHTLPKWISWTASICLGKAFWLFPTSFSFLAFIFLGVSISTHFQDYFLRTKMGENVSLWTKKAHQAWLLHSISIHSFPFRQVI